MHGLPLPAYKTIRKRWKCIRIQSSRKVYCKVLRTKKEGARTSIWGDVGTGKSYTAAAIANALMERRVSVIMTSLIKILSKVGNTGVCEDTIENLNRPQLLILDDFGAERSTDYVLENVYNIIDSRYRSGKPLILTTNLTLEEMKRTDDRRYQRIYDRIFFDVFFRFDSLARVSERFLQSIGLMRCKRL